MSAPTQRHEVAAFLTLLFGGVVDETGRFRVGQMPIWNRASKRTTWCASIDEAADAISTASEAGQDAYFPVALHDPAVALDYAQRSENQEAEHKGRAPRTLTQAYVRGCAESAVAIVGLWLDEDHAEGQHKRDNLPPDLAAVRDYLGQVPHPLGPSIVLDTGGGAHAWLLFREPFLIESEEDRARAASLARRYQTLVVERVAPQYAHDPTADLARILRVPGALNSKYGSLARVVDPATGEATGVPEDVRRIDVSEVENEFDLHAVRDDGPPAKRRPEAGPATTMGTQLSSRVQGLLDGSSRIRDLFLGKGKPELGPDGRTLDTTSSGYDFSLVMALARKGVIDRSELATAVRLRPDGAAAAKGLRYVAATVDRALERVEAIGKERAAQAHATLDFQVDRVRVFDCNPAQYELTVSGTPLRFTTSQLLSPTGFVRVFTDAMKRVPSIPSESDDWIPIVNGWLEQAERVDMPPEASDESALREAVERQVADLPVGDAAEDLDHGKAVTLDDGRLAFKVDTLLRALKEDHPRLTRTQICRVLRDLGFASSTHRVGGEPLRAWAGQPTDPSTRVRPS
jgi:hypothetical protein